MKRTIEQYQRACESLAGGVSSSTRVNQALGHAMYFARGDGCRVWDLDGTEYIDLCCSHGATLLGHGDRRVRRAVEAALRDKRLTMAESGRLMRRYEEALEGYTYLTGTE